MRGSEKKSTGLLDQKTAGVGEQNGVSRKDKSGVEKWGHKIEMTLR